MKHYQLPFWVAIMSFVFILYGIGIQVDKNITALKTETSELKSYNTILVNAMGYMQDAKKKMMEASFEWPVMPEDFTYLTSPFGIRDIPKQLYTGGGITREHSGTDFAGTFQARILAVAPGKVIDKYYSPGWHLGVHWSGHPVLGGMIKIKHIDGTYSIYGHLSEIYVSEGNIVYAGQIIGRMGDTGISTGQHLHFELHDENDEPIQSLLFLKDPRNE